MMRELITPIINLNGDTKRELIDQLAAVMLALTSAQEAMAKARPHGRNYQTHRTAFADIDARKAWSEREVVLRDLANEIEAYAYEIVKQGDVRDRHPYACEEQPALPLD